MDRLLGLRRWIWKTEAPTCSLQGGHGWKISGRSRAYDLPSNITRISYNVLRIIHLLIDGALP